MVINPRNPTGDGRIQKGLDHADSKADEAKAKARANVIWEFTSSIKHCFIHQSGQRVYEEIQSTFEDQIPLEERRAIIAAIKADPEVLSEKARLTIVYAENLEAARTSNERYAAGMTEAGVNALNRLEYQKNHGIVTPKPQTLKLTEKARKAMNLMGTPEFMTDEQIKETNEHYANHEAVEVLDDGEVFEE